MQRQSDLLRADGSWITLPANLCRGLTGGEAFCLYDDFCESVGQPVEAGACGAALQRAAEHLQHMLGAG